MPTLLGLFMLYAFYKFGTSSSKDDIDINFIEESEDAFDSIDLNNNESMNVSYQKRSKSAVAIKQYIAQISRQNSVMFEKKSVKSGLNSNSVNKFIS